VILASNAPAVRSVGEAIWPRLLLDEACPSWASGVPRVCPLPLGGPHARRNFIRDYSSRPRLGSGEARSRPLGSRSLDLNRTHQSLRFVLMVVYQPCLGVLGVPLIMVPDIWATRLTGDDKWRPWWDQEEFFLVEC
jgi:hypothetical protein